MGAGIQKNNVEERKDRQEKDHRVNRSGEVSQRDLKADFSLVSLSV